MIWSVAEILRGDFKQSEYQKVVLPFTVLRRLDAVLADRKVEFLERAKGVEGMEGAEMALQSYARDIYGHSFYNLAETVFQFDRVRGVVKRIDSGGASKSSNLVAALRQDIEDRGLHASDLWVRARQAAGARRRHWSTELCRPHRRGSLIADRDLGFEPSRLADRRGRRRNRSRRSRSSRPSRRGSGQAIEEGFILDVLANYTTYKSYWQIEKTIREDPNFDERKAKAAIALWSPSRGRSSTVATSTPSRG